VPLRVAAAVDRALEKDPAQRFPTMEAFAAELEACLAALDAPGDVDDGKTIVKGRHVVSRPRRRRKHVSRWAVGSVLLGMLALAAVIVGLLALQGIHGGGTPSQAATIHLRGVGSWDPFGNNKEEHSSAAPNATDRNPSTYWYTQTYYDGGGSLGKAGVGIVLAAAQPSAVKSVTVTTDTPGYTAQILAGGSPGGPFSPDSASQTVNTSTTFALQGRTARYYVVWITNLGPQASVHVNEVRAAG